MQKASEFRCVGNNFKMVGPSVVKLCMRRTCTENVKNNINIHDFTRPQRTAISLMTFESMRGNTYHYILLTSRETPAREQTAIDASRDRSQNLKLYTNM